MPNVSAIFTLLRTKRRVEVENAFFFLHREKTDQRETSGKRLLKCIANKKNIYLFYKYDMIFQCASLFRGTREIQVPM